MKDRPSGTGSWQRAQNHEPQRLDRDRGGSAGDSGRPVSVAAAEVAIPVSARIEDAGKIRFCTALPYPPVIYQEGDTIVGSNADTGVAIAEKLGVEVD